MKLNLVCIPYSYHIVTDLCSRVTGLSPRISQMTQKSNLATHWPRDIGDIWIRDEGLAPAEYSKRWQTQQLIYPYFCSNLGPLLFLLYINDLALVSPKLVAILFADDSSFFCTGKDLPSLIETVNSELTIIVSWLNVNKMSLNIEKTSYMIFRSRNKKLDPGNDIFINGCKIEQVQTTKFLGVIIDCNLTWKYHISYVCSKISKNIGILIKSRKVFDTNTLLTLCYSFIYPYLNYCVHLWGSTYDTYVNKIFLLQKKAMRIILGVNQRAHSEPLFSSLCVLSVSNVYMYNIGLLMYKYHHVLLPNILDMFEQNSTIHQYYTRQSNLLHVPSCRTELGKRFFRVQSCHYMEWNS